MSRAIPPFFGKDGPVHPQDAVDRFRDRLAILDLCARNPEVIESTIAEDYATCLLDDCDALAIAVEEWFRAHCPEHGLLGAETVAARRLAKPPAAVQLIHDTLNAFAHLNDVAGVSPNPRLLERLRAYLCEHTPTPIANAAKEA